MVVYPLVTQWLGFDAVMAGKFIGATIHDVAQVVGAGYSLSPAGGGRSHHHQADARGVLDARAGRYLAGGAGAYGEKARFNGHR
jgi:hypothetical protein